MVQQNLLEGIAYWREVGSAEGDIDVYALGDEAQLNQEGDMDERFCVLQLALVGCLLDTVQASNDMISVNLEMNKLMWFYGMGLCQDKEFWRQKYTEHGAAMRFAFDSATVGSNLAIEIINKEVADFNAGESSLQGEWVNILQVSIDKFNHERTRLGQFSEIYQVVNDKIGRRESHYIESYRPNISPIALRDHFLSRHREVGAIYAENAAKANIEVAKALLVRGSFIEQRAIPCHPAEDAAHLRRNVAKMRENAAASLERAAVWLDIQSISEGYVLPDGPQLP